MALVALLHTSGRLHRLGKAEPSACSSILSFETMHANCRKRPPSTSAFLSPSVEGRVLSGFGSKVWRAFSETRATHPRAGSMPLGKKVPRSLAKVGRYVCSKCAKDLQQSPTCQNPSMDDNLHREHRSFTRLRAEPVGSGVRQC